METKRGPLVIAYYATVNAASGAMPTKRDVGTLYQHDPRGLIAARKLAKAVGYEVWECDDSGAPFRQVAGE